MLAARTVPCRGHGGALVGPVYYNTVRCSWGRWSLLLHWLVQRGWTVLQVDVRGSAGNSRAFRDEFACDVGGRDLDDVAAAAQFLRSLPTVAPDRVGMWGSSYGGTLTCMALFRRPRLFNAGVACAPATHGTAPLLATCTCLLNKYHISACDAAHFFGPDDVAVVRHPEVAGGSPGRAMDENYARNSAITSAAGLCRPLLVIHGMQDDVVPFKTTLMLAEQLMLAGNRMFELATAPAATHDWAAQPHVAAYLYTRLLAHFERHLLGISDSHRIDSY
jgi:dipeptidyl-peptidase-4